MRQRAAGEAGAGAAGDEGHRVLGAGADDGRELRGVLGYDHERGRDPVVGQPVALVGAQPGASVITARRAAAAGAGGDRREAGHRVAGPGPGARSCSSSPALLSFGPHAISRPGR